MTMMAERAPDAFTDVVGAAFGALLLDDDVSEVFVIEGGALEVVRRGRHERLDASVDADLWPAARTTLGDDDEKRVAAGPLVTISRFDDARLALRIEKREVKAPYMLSLFEEGLVEEETAAELVRALGAGRTVVIAGPSRAGRMRLASALAREIAARTRAFDIGEVAVAGALRPGGPNPAARAAQGLSLGAAALSWLEAEPRALARLIAARPDALVLASLGQARPESLLGQLGAEAGEVAWAVVGFAPDGRPTVVDAGGALAVRGAVSTAAVSPSSTSRVAAAPPVEPAAVAAPRRAPSTPGPIVVDAGADLPPLLPLPAGPPAGWASEADDDAPGWELAAPPDEVAPSAQTDGGVRFAAMLDEVRARPTFTPRPPPVHPQTSALKAGARGTDPLGGLTLEPPGGSFDDDAEDPEA